MKFTNARCELCTADIFSPVLMMAFTIKRDGKTKWIERVNLEGQQPWSGIRCVCQSCTERIEREIIKERQ